ncbi:MAG TPA: NAD(P)-binding domain-containing protein, partial [Holophagaceae bacterium]|nr:NAD(P)-binding domain-containing protein [Holophagaceae bacterium]
MEPVLFSFHAPVHELDLVGRQVVREGLAARMREWQQGAGASELVYLATCQRVMWMFWGGDPGRLKSLESAVRFEGDAARGHLLALSAGLESANLGDREIPDQMRDALAQAREVGTAGEEAHASLEDAIREGQRLRARLGMADGSISVATAALRHLTDALPEGASIAVVGVGPMSHYLAARLPERGFRVTLSNRTLSKAEDLAAELGISQTISLSHLQRNPDGFDALVTATASPVPLFTLEAWGGLPKRAPLRILDLALPVDSEPALEQLCWVHRLDLGVF